MAPKGAKARAASAMAPKTPPPRKGCGLCCQVIFYLWVTQLAEFTGFWSRFTELPYECEHPPVPGNRSGIKALVAGYAKTGTRGMSRVLYQLGLEHSYHSEEFNMHVWAPYADKFWKDRVDGLWTFTPPPGFGHVSKQADHYLINRTNPEELGTAISRCRVDALAFDGIERAFWPVYESSPDAKVIVLNWRTYEEWRKSLDNFAPALCVQIWIEILLAGGQMVLPWGALFRLVDPLLMDRQIERLLKTGGPPINQVYDWYTSLWHAQVGIRRIATRWISGMAFFPDNEFEYYATFDDVLQRVPKERRMEVNPKKHTYEDLCRFLEIDPCPRQGKMDKAVNMWNFEQDFPEAAMIRWPIHLLLHVLSFNILRFLYNRLCCCCCCCCRRAREKTD